MAKRTQDGDDGGIQFRISEVSSLLIPATANAFEFNHKLWPSPDMMAIGRSGKY